MSRPAQHTLSRTTSGSAIDLGFMARAFVQTTLPHKSTDALVFTRRNGRLTLKITADKDFGLPYGRYPRLLLAWMTREACRTKSRRLELGRSLSSFMNEIGLTPTGGQSGTIPRLRDQMARLFLSTVSFTDFDPGAGRLTDDRFTIADKTRLWWSPSGPGDEPFWGSYVILSELGFRALAEKPVPIDMATLRGLRSPLALDIYCWLTYRNSYLRRPTRIPWPALAEQFGAGYNDRRNFKRKFRAALLQVLMLYPSARVAAVPGGLRLHPSASHVRQAQEF
ncbi:MAG: pirin [bacterium]|nr:pirin [bacterium]